MGDISNNILLINDNIQDYHIIIEACNVNTYPITYNQTTDTYDSIFEKYQSLLNDPSNNIQTIDHVALVSHGIFGNTFTFLEKEDTMLLSKYIGHNKETENIEPLRDVSGGGFSEPEPEPQPEHEHLLNNLETWSSFKDFIQKFNIQKSLDFLGCALLQSSNWKYILSELETEQHLNLNIRASDDDTGNIKVGGDWVLESDNVNIKELYFDSELIEEYTGRFFWWIIEAAYRAAIAAAAEQAYLAAIAAQAEVVALAAEAQAKAAEALAALAVAEALALEEAAEQVDLATEAANAAEDLAAARDDVEGAMAAAATLLNTQVNAVKDLLSYQINYNVDKRAEWMEKRKNFDKAYYLGGGRRWDTPTMKIIAGTNEQRDTGASFGHIRYNTQANAVEIWHTDGENGPGWRDLSSNETGKSAINFSGINDIKEKTFITQDGPSIALQDGVYEVYDGSVGHLKIEKTNIDIVGNQAVMSLSHGGALRLAIERGGIAFSSDDRLKHNEEVIPNSLDLIEQLKPYKYQKTDKMYDASYNGIIHDKWVWEIGLIAQDVSAIPYLNFMVNQMPNDGMYTLSYFNLIGLLLQGAKDLYNENKLLKKDIVTCKKDTQDLSGSFPVTIVELNNKIEELESLVLALEN